MCVMPKAKRPLSTLCTLNAYQCTFRLHSNTQLIILSTFHVCLQLAGICVALGISLVWGLIVGVIVTYCNPFREQDLSAAECFDDGPW
ncbi:hypothetical protein DUNSADRAFT_702 [Dunaliella salina]|uniref:Uncharacterized protein n=1 Tax=Dunaliella salina TaxID=3046 RepID=A0ABQ7FYI9_DUNSA|nr:hypothetical protein DUNSADRAFT_702 [Dunaliella salina]|eukprot:KAF5827414.1 hypothetical protein DUNSADRAFT_702 [Dunaliella salina]